MTAEPTHNQLKSLIEKIESLEAEKAEVANLVRDAFLEARLAGFDPKIMRQVLKLRKMKKHEYLEQEQLLGTYLSAVGMLEEGSADTASSDSQSETSTSHTSSEAA